MLPVGLGTGTAEQVLVPFFPARRSHESTVMYLTSRKARWSSIWRKFTAASAHSDRHTMLAKGHHFPDVPLVYGVARTSMARFFPQISFGGTLRPALHSLAAPGARATGRSGAQHQLSIPCCKRYRIKVIRAAEQALAERQTLQLPPDQPRHYSRRGITTISRFVFLQQLRNSIQPFAIRR